MLELNGKDIKVDIKGWKLDVKTVVTRQDDLESYTAAQIICEPRRNV